MNDNRKIVLVVEDSLLIIERILSDEAEELSSGKKVALFRIVQELGKNTLKFSKGKNPLNQLNADDKNGNLIVEDDGVWFGPQQTRRGNGLSNFYERIKFYDGD